MLKLRRIRLNDYNVIENDQRIGRIHYAVDRTPRVWVWYVQVHLGRGLPMGASRTFEAAKHEFKSARTPPEKLVEAFRVQ
jgi:hypothetical protein